MLTGKKILLTGLTGRVGGAFANALADNNELWGLARYSPAGSEDYWKSRGVKTVVCDFGSGDFSGVPTDFDYVINPGAWAGLGPTPMPDEAIRHNAEGPALLMNHCRKAKAFLHVSTTGVYHGHTDPMHRYKETDHVAGSPSMLDYTASKLAGEGAVRAMCRILDLPTIICRLNMQYGPWGDCGSPNRRVLQNLVNRIPVPIPADGRPAMFSLIYNDDLIDWLEPCLNAAAVPAPIVNWGGDVDVSFEDMAIWMGQLTGIEPIFEKISPYNIPPYLTDNTFRTQIAGPCKVHWKDGFREVVRFAHPEIEIRA